MLYYHNWLKLFFLASLTTQKTQSKTRQAFFFFFFFEESLPRSSLKLLSTKLPPLEMNEMQRKKIPGMMSHGTLTENPSRKPRAVSSQPQGFVRNEEHYLGRGMANRLRSVLID